MTHEENILALLKEQGEQLAQFQTRLSAIESSLSLLTTQSTANRTEVHGIRGDVDDIRTGQARMQEDLSALKEQTAEIKTEVDYIWEDLSRDEKRIKANETAIRSMFG